MVHSLLTASKISVDFMRFTVYIAFNKLGIDMTEKYKIALELSKRLYRPETEEELETYALFLANIMNEVSTRRPNDTSKHNKQRKDSGASYTPQGTNKKRTSNLSQGS